VRWQASSKILHSKTLVLDVLVLVLCIMVFSVLIQDVDEVDVYVDDVVDVAVPCDCSFSSGFLAIKESPPQGPSQIKRSSTGLNKMLKNPPYICIKFDPF